MAFRNAIGNKFRGDFLFQSSIGAKIKYAFMLHHSQFMTRKKVGTYNIHTMFNDGRRKGGIVAEKLDRLEVCGFAGKSKHKGFFWMLCVCIIASFFH